MRCYRFVLLLLVAGLAGSAAAEDAAAASASSEQTAHKLAATDYRAEIEYEVGRMDGILDNMTIALGQEDTTDDAPQEEDTVAAEWESLPPGRVLSKRSELRLPPLGMASLELDDLLAEYTLEPCKAEDVNPALSASAAVLDKVSAGELSPDVLAELQEQNGNLENFLTACSLSAIEKGEKKGILDNVYSVKTHVAAAAAAAALPETGLEVSSAYMVVLIAFSCLMALLALVGLAVLAHRYMITSSAPASRPQGVVGQQNAAYQPTDPPGSLHQARNERWRRHSDVELESPRRPPAAKKSTWGRIWGGVVRDYQRSRDSVAESRPEHRQESRYPPTSRYPDESRRERRASPPPRRATPPPRRSSPPPRRASPPPRRASPPPRRSSPPPQSDGGGDNWAYGPTGRNKSTDSPFASAW